ncbi:MULTISPECIES: TIGR04086 family membrane protein [unclassified Ruminococcus]|uniref:TIGR04086 family membrane protein n=1 Tax=unclassified Ruminococcus TaxID=2608920 RepID=UPI00210DDE88|nr:MULTISPECIES: TIGR04086 family membrane protein [unclassified Ruminococcus]MCQ4022463.1 TIGR04086 family membrane protein [Ruminococcus sp. zg-924]MCQ4115727.1 TIGR04086 family membrane protein [Ruminococcus sp. zg-921]
MEMNKSVKGIVIGGIAEIIVCILLFLITAFALTKAGYIPDNIISTLTTVLSGASCFVGGFIAGRLVKKSGIFIGAATGVILLLLQLIISLISGGFSLSIMIIIKAAALILSGAIGGIFGVNKKEKLH